MPSREILESYTVTDLRKEISKTNIKRYSSMKKSEVIELMKKPEHNSKFNHLKMKEKPAKEKKVKLTVTKADGTVKQVKMKKKKPATPKKEKKEEEVVKPTKPLSPGQIEAERIKAKVRKAKKAKSAPPAKKKTAGEKLTGLTKAQMNKLSPSELFGKLPVALAKKALTSGTKVGTSQELVTHIFELDKGETLEDEIDYIDNLDISYKHFYPALIHPAEKPNKKLASWNKEFGSKSFKKEQRNDETEGNLMDIAHYIKFNDPKGNFNDIKKHFRKNMPAYYAYWLEYYMAELKKKNKKK